MKTPFIRGPASSKPHKRPTEGGGDMGPLYERPLPFPPEQHPTARTDYSRDRDGVGCRWRLPAVGFAETPSQPRPRHPPRFGRAGGSKQPPKGLSPRAATRKVSEGAPRGRPLPPAI